MRKSYYLILLLCVGWFCIPSSLHAQNSQVRVTGVVIDESTNDYLPGVQIVVEGAEIGVISGMDGKYSLLVPGPDAVLVFSFIGYEEQKITVGDQKVIDIRLSPVSVEIDAVSITAQAIGQIGAQQQQINSTTIKNVVASDRLQKNPDANAIEAIGRLPGLSVLRSGGEGSQIVIRGMQPQYTNVTLNGINLAGGQGNLRGISQFALEGAEVYKALTPNLESNAVGGTINLTTKEIREGLHFNVLAQGGYNDLNSDYGNYLLQGNVSNRFFKKRLGVSLITTAERRNRSVQTMSASYGIQGQEIDILINRSNLNLINRINTRRSANLALDYRLGSSTLLKMNGIFAYSNTNTQRQSKNYNHTGAGGVSYSMQYTPINENRTLHTSLSGRTNVNFLNMVIDYGGVFSENKGFIPDSRTWGFTVANASTADITTVEMRRRGPEELIPLFTDDEVGLQNTASTNFTTTDTDRFEKDITGYLDIEIPLKIGEKITGSFKTGGRYRQKSLASDVLSGRARLNFFNDDLWYDNLPDLVRNNPNDAAYSLVGFEDYEVTDFLGGEYDYGSYFNFDKLNRNTDWWQNFSDSLFAEGLDVWFPLVGGKSQALGFTQELEASMFNDRDIVQDYYAGYAMAEFNFGKWAMFLPGFRYETTNTRMNGLLSIQPDENTIPNIQDPIIGNDTSATRVDEFLLPMVHLRLKPVSFAYVHLAYTQSISRPGFNQISPNIFVDPQTSPGTFKSKNPELKTEHWTNYDAQITFHSRKIGLLSVSGFYKTVVDKIWNRQYKRIKGDPLVPFYAANNVVDMDIWENHPFDVTLRGFEVEWQTAFWYLPKPFQFFTLNLNYTFTDSETKYPYSRLEDVIPPDGGRPVTMRVDSVIAGPMLFQPRHIANASLGFNYKGFNTWFSFQYNGQVFTSKNFFVDELDRLKEDFYRLDLQMTYKLPIKKLPGQMQLLGNIANISNFNEVSRLRGDSRFTYREAYGYTADLGIRYTF